MPRVLGAVFKCRHLPGIDDCHTFDGFLSRYCQWFRDGDGLRRSTSYAGSVRLAPAELRELLVALCDALMEHLGKLPTTALGPGAASCATLGEWMALTKTRLCIRENWSADCFSY